MPPGWVMRSAEKKPSDSSSEQTPEKPIEEMSDAELAEALAKAKRELLDAQRAELEAHKQALVEGEEGRLIWQVKARPYWQ